MGVVGRHWSLGFVAIAVGGCASVLGITEGSPAEAQDGGSAQGGGGTSQDGASTGGAGGAGTGGAGTGGASGAGGAGAGGVNDAGLKLDGAACDQTAECAAGLACVRISPAQEKGICQYYCEGIAECSTRYGKDASRCVAIESVTTCTIPCDPLTGSGCPAGFACSLVLPSLGGWGTSCTPVGTGGHGAPCNETSYCAVAYQCLNATPTATVCFQICNVSQGGPCGQGTCTQFQEVAMPNALIDGAEYGICG